MMTSEHTRRMDPFRHVDADERRSHLERYERFLAERDGAQDFENRTLSLREVRMRDFEEKEVSWGGDFDHDGFARAWDGDRKIRLDPRTEWMIAAGKAAEGEIYGVDLEFRRYQDRGGYGTDCEGLIRRVLLQETYHCRTLAELCRTCGFDVSFRPPGWANRQMMRVIGALPARARWVPVLAGEVVGSEVFRLLGEQCAVFDAEPEVASRLRALIREIWIDETLHVAFFRAQLGPGALRAARRAVPIIAKAVLRDVPRLAHLGLTEASLLPVLDRGVAVPPEVDWEL